VRIRIALTTAIAVIAGMTTGIFTLSARGAASAHGTSTHSHAARVQLPKSALSAFALPRTVPVVTTTPPPPATTTTTTPPPVVTPTTTPPAPPSAPVTDANSVSTADWSCIRMHESGDRYNSPAAPSGAYGILISTWRSYGLSGWPYEAPASLQDHVALELYARYGFQPWSSRYACGL
jgi:Transglycosylase-like domain